MNFGENIKRIRERNDLTQEEFGERIGVTQVYVSYLESGCKIPTPQLIYAIAISFHVPTDEIFFGTDYLLNVEQVDTA